MKLTISKRRDHILIHLEGNLELGKHEKLKEELVQAAPEKGTQVLLDLSKVGFIDSSCLGVLVGFARKIREKGGDVKLCRLTQEVKSIFNITRLDKVFKIYSSLDDAEASFAT